MKRFLLILLMIPTLFTLSCQSGGDSKSTVKLVKKKVQDLQPTQFAARMEKSNTILLDIRTPAEVKERGTIEGSTFIDFYAPNFVENVEKLDHSKELLIYCASGGRSAKAANQLSEKGFPQIVNLKGGYTAWSRAFPKK